MTDSPTILPDFIIIGAMKCATSTLHEQLAQLPSVFMSTPKEPNFFSDDEIYDKGIKYYSGLFEGGSDHLKGESSTHYTKFPTHSETLERMKLCGIESKCRFIYVVRDPVQRLISQYMHEWTQGVIKSPIDQAINTHPELVEYSKYSYQLSKYRKAFPDSRILLVFYESMISQPDKVFPSICSFLGLPKESSWDHNMEAKNRSSQRLRSFPLYGLLIDSALMVWIRRNLIPQSIRDLVKKRLTMQKRPELNDSSMRFLKDTFNEDLKRLGDLTGLPLTIENYQTVSQESEPKVIR